MGQTGRVDPIRPMMLNGFHGLCRVTRKIIVFVSCLEPRPVNINGSCSCLGETGCWS